jgi:hypothetical protein
MALDDLAHTSQERVMRCYGEFKMSFRRIYRRYVLYKLFIHTLCERIKEQ